MSLYSDTIASQSYRFKRLMLANANTEIEQTLRNSRLLFEKLDQVLDSPTEATEAYRANIEELARVHKSQAETTQLKEDIEKQYIELKKLL